MTNPTGVPQASTHVLTPWCTPEDIPQDRIIDGQGRSLEDVDLEWMCAASTELLYILSGRKYRTGRTIARPTRVVNPAGTAVFLYPYNAMSGYGNAFGFAAGWAWPAVGAGWGFGEDGSQCLLQGPVTAVNSVIVDGVTLPATAYTVYDGRRLVRNIDATGQAGGWWPWNQDLSLPITSPGTWQIDWNWGNAPPQAGKLAAAELAIELAVSFSGQDKSRLPARVLSIATEGVNVAVGDAMEYLMMSLTGLPICDIFLRAVNPSGRRRRSVILSPESVLNRSV